MADLIDQSGWHYSSQHLGLLCYLPVLLIFLLDILKSYLPILVHDICHIQLDPSCMYHVFELTFFVLSCALDQCRGQCPVLLVLLNPDF